MKFKNYNTSRILSLMALAAMALATSCSNDSFTDGDNPDSGEGKTVVLTAKLKDNKNSGTRVGMTKDNATTASFYWHNGDEILVQSNKKTRYYGEKFSTSTVTGETEATFTGTVTSGRTLASYAVYPYNKNHSFSSATELTYYMPASYTYDKVESKIFSNLDTETYPENSTKIPLVGKIEDDYIEFKHIGGLAIIRISEMPTTEGTLTITTNEQLSGKFTIADLTVEEPVMTTATSTSNNSVKFAFSNATKGAVGVFYLPLATGSYSGVTVNITSTDETVNSTANYDDFEISRGSIVALSLSDGGDGGSDDDYTIDSDGNYIINGHKFVDLGLDSGVLWAETNIGANSATDGGDYFAWAEVTAKTEFYYSNYKYYVPFEGYTKYTQNDKINTLEKEDDAAYVNWGSSFRMPTIDEFKELMDKCTMEETIVNNKDGYKFTSKTNGKSIFFPAMGYIDTGVTVYGVYYWSSSLDLDTDNGANAFLLGYNGSISTLIRINGCPIRPVADK